MKTQIKFSSAAKFVTSLLAISLLLAACSGGSSSGGGSGGAVTGVATPSKVSVVNTN